MYNMYPFRCSSDKEPASEVITSCIAPHLPSRLLFSSHSWDPQLPTPRITINIFPETPSSFVQPLPPPPPPLPYPLLPLVSHISTQSNLHAHPPPAFFCTILFLDLVAGGQDPLTSSKL